MSAKNEISKVSEQLKAIKSNNNQHLQQLYISNFPATEKYVLQNGGTAEQAKDIFQEAFISVWKNIQLDKFVPQREHSLDAYIFQVSKYKWLSHLRTVAHKSTVPILEDFDYDITDQNPASENNSITCVAEYFKQLGDNCKEVLNRFYYGKESMKAIAALFGWTEATAKNNKYRCIEKLRSLLKNKKLA